MAEVKGKFITLAAELLTSKHGVRSAAIGAIRRVTGKSPRELEPEGWYDTNVLNGFFSAVESYESPLVAWAAIRVIGRNVYPAVDAIEGSPKRLRTPLNLLKSEAEVFLRYHRGSDVVPRKFLQSEDRCIIVEAPSPGYNCALIEGVFDGILCMCHITHGTVKQTKCIRKGDSTCEYTIQW
ncbi:MAG TPA: hypothetical protein VK463_06995 [Desulfomonilaceae bacterium]|nr:hypothetical protein [Desulfomonilaceae bacterium]